MIDDRIEEMAAELRRQGDRARSIRSELEAMTARVDAVDGSVTVTVTAAGMVERIVIHEVGARMDNHRLGVVVTETINRASGEVRAAVRARLRSLDQARERLTNELTKQGNPVGAALADLVESVAPPPQTRTTRGSNSNITDEEYESRRDHGWMERG